MSLMIKTWVSIQAFLACVFLRTFESICFLVPKAFPMPVHPMVKLTLSFNAAMAEADVTWKFLFSDAT